MAWLFINRSAAFLTTRIMSEILADCGGTTVQTIGRFNRSTHGVILLLLTW
jgi:hypothetical protein